MLRYKRELTVANSQIGVARPSFNLIMLGTGEHHGRHDTVLTALARTIEQTPNQKVHVIDGPGAYPPLGSSHPMLGTYHFDCQLDLETLDVLPIKTLKTGYFEATSILSGLITGGGTQDAIAEAVKYIDIMMRANKKPLVINLFGYSRGSDTILRLSNVLYHTYQRADLEINIFAIDPVPGPRRHGSIHGRLVDVNDYEAIYMKHETRPYLALQDLTQLDVKNPEAFRVHILSGEHSNAKRFRAHPNSIGDDLASTTMDAARLLWHNIHAFAKRHGIRFKNNQQIPFVWNITDEDFRSIPQTETDIREEERDLVRLNLYTQMLLKENFYKQYSSQIGLEREFVSRKMDYFFHGTHFFQDKQHVELFQKQYPNFFDYFFQKNKERKTRAEVMADIVKMRHQDPDLITLLQEKMVPGLRAIRSGDALPPPRGIPVIMLAFYQNKELMRLHWGVQSACLAVIGGHDPSIPPEVAEQVLNLERKILLSDISDNEKIRRLELLISQVVLHHQKDGDFVCKLVGLLGNNKVMEITARHLMSRCLAEPEIKNHRNLSTITKACNTAINTIDAENEAQRVKKTMQHILTFQQSIQAEPESPLQKKILAKANSLLRFTPPTLTVADHIISAMDSYINRFEWFGIFRDTDLTERKKDIAQLVKAALLELKFADAGNKIFAIKQILDLAAATAGQIRRSKNQAEGYFDHILLRCRLSLANKGAADRTAVIDDIISRFNKQMDNKIKHLPRLGLFDQRRQIVKNQDHRNDSNKEPVKKIAILSRCE